MGIRVTVNQRRQLRVMAAERDVSVQTLVQSAIAGLLGGASEKVSEAKPSSQPTTPKPSKPKAPKPKVVAAAVIEPPAEPWDPAADPFEVASRGVAKSEDVDLQADPFAE